MKKIKSHILKVFTVVLVLITEIARADQNETKKCDDGWQGAKCEVCR